MSDSKATPTLPDWIQDHIKLYLEDPEKAHMWDSSALGGPGVLPTLLLTTTGNKSGEPRMLPLIYGKIERGFVIIASKGGFPSHPTWYLNLQKTPKAHICVGADEYDVLARTTEGEEREVLWKMMAGIYAPYDDYQAAATSREIPVVVLEPIEDADEDDGYVD